MGYFGSPIAHISGDIPFLTDLLLLNAIIYDLLRNYPGSRTYYDSIPIQNPDFIRIAEMLHVYSSVAVEKVMGRGRLAEIC